MFTVGVYDLMHVGHVELFRRAKSLGDRLIVGVQDSGSVQKYKPSAKPVYSTEERAYLVSSISYVDEVVIYEDVEGIVRPPDDSNPNARTNAAAPGRMTPDNDMTKTAALNL